MKGRGKGLGDQGGEDQERTRAKEVRIKRRAEMRNVSGKSSKEYRTRDEEERNRRRARMRRDEQERIRDEEKRTRDEEERTSMR